MKIDSYVVKEEKFETTTKPHNLPLLATSSFSFKSIDQGIRIFSGEEEGHVYGRYGNPTIETVANKIAKLESFDLNDDAFGVMVSSGMSAISTLVFAELKHGDTLLTQEDLYGGSTELFKKISDKMGIKLVYANMRDIVSVEQAIQNSSNVKMIYCETPSNPSLACVDLLNLARLANDNNIIAVIDNTFCTPYIQRPLNFGFDYVVHSTTKYLNGHGNSIAGIIVGQNSENYQKVWDSMKLLGTNCNPFDAWLTNNGLKTLALRMEKHSQNALFLAEALEGDSRIELVNYPFLDSHADVQLAKRQMSFGGGMISFEVKGGLDAGIRFMNKINFSTLAPTLGDVDSLILHPASMSHRNVDPEVRMANGITDGLIRFSVGIENKNDILTDLMQALEK